MEKNEFNLSKDEQLFWKAYAMGFRDGFEKCMERYDPTLENPDAEVDSSPTLN